jgi:hypothetical protein
MILGVSRRLILVAAVILVAAGAGTLAAELTTSAPKVPLVESVQLSPGYYGLGVDHGQVAVSTGDSANGCSAQLFEPTSLRLVQTVSSCVGWGTPGEYRQPLVVSFGRTGEEIHAAVTNPVTDKTSPGPLLFTIDNWSWAHSGVTSGDGNLWLWNLNTKALIEASLTTGQIEHRWTVEAGGNPWMAVNADGFWMTDSVWGGGPFEGNTELWHVAPGSSELVVARRLESGTQWFVTAERSLYLGELSPTPGGYTQSVWRLDGPDATVAFETPATLLPADDFGGTGYIVEGNSEVGYFTVSQLGSGHTPAGIGDCDSSAPLRIVRIDPATGRQSYVAALPAKDTGSYFQCSVDDPPEMEFYDGALYLLADTQRPGDLFGMLVRVGV